MRLRIAALAALVGVTLVSSPKAEAVQVNNAGFSCAWALDTGCSYRTNIPAPPPVPSVNFTTDPAALVVVNSPARPSVSGASAYCVGGPTAWVCIISNVTGPVVSASASPNSSGFFL